MSLLKATTNKGFKTDEECRQGIADALVPINKDYVWELAESDKKTRNPQVDLWLTKFEDNGLTRVAYFTLKDFQAETITWLSQSLVINNPDAKLLTTEIIDYKQMLMCGRYTNEFFEEIEPDEREQEFISSQHVDMDEINDKRVRIRKSLPPLKSNYYWSIRADNQYPEPFTYSLCLFEVDGDIEVALGGWKLRDMSRTSMKETSRRILKSNPQAEAGYITKHVDKINHHIILGFYVSNRN